MNKITGYLVEVGYRKFEFPYEKYHEAINFAGTAAMSCTDEHSVTLTILTEDEDVPMS